MNKYWHTKNGFGNPDGSPGSEVNISRSIRYLWSRVISRPLDAETDVPDSHILTAKECLAQMERNRKNDHITWLGHCAFIIQMDGIRFLTDPFLEGTVGPSIIRGMKRLPCPLPFRNIEFDFLLLSHEHQDHLHAPSIKKIPGLHEKVAIVPLKVGKKIRKLGLSETKELDWFESTAIPNSSISITALPACHYSSVPGNKTLWSGFLISSKLSGRKIYFSGDTAYGPFFRRDIVPYGPFDAALVGVGTYYLPFPSRINFVHTNPQEAVRMAVESGSKHLIGMHWGTVKMSEDNQKEIPGLLERARKEENYDGRITCMKIGETIPL